VRTGSLFYCNDGVFQDRTTAETIPETGADLKGWSRGVDMGTSLLESTSKILPVSADHLVNTVIIL
jgi:hypothetical protein